MCIRDRSLAISLDISSNVGAICLQGPHHSAQKSTITGLPALITSDSKFSSVTLTVAIKLIYNFISVIQHLKKKKLNYPH